MAVDPSEFYPLLRSEVTPPPPAPTPMPEPGTMSTGQLSQEIAKRQPPPQDPLVLANAGPSTPMLATAQPPVSATLGTEVRLSDGSRFKLDPGLVDTQAGLRKIQQAEAEHDKMYMRQAAESGAPFVPNYDGQEGEKIYSAYGAYPNNTVGKARAYLDHTTVGGGVKRVANAVDDFSGGNLSRIAQGTERAGVNYATAIPDLVIDLTNRFRHQFPSAAQSDPESSIIAQNNPAMGAAIPPNPNPPQRDMPLLGPSAQRALAIPEQPMDASGFARGLEAVGSGAMGGEKALLREALSTGSAASRAGRALPALMGDIARQAPAAAGYALTGQIGGDVGKRFGGETGEWAGGLVGGGAANPLLQGAARGIAPAIRAGGGQARRTWDATRALGITPSFISLANAPMQRLAAAFRGVVGLGNPLERGTEEHRTGLDRSIRETAAGIYGPGMPPHASEEASQEASGQNMIEGAQTALTGPGDVLSDAGGRPLPNVKVQGDRLYDPVHQAMNDPNNPDPAANRKIDIQPIVDDMTQRFLRNPGSPVTEAAIWQILQDHLANRSTGQPPLNFVGPRQPGEMSAPWDVVREFKSMLNERLRNANIGLSEQKAVDLRNATDQTMVAGANRAVPGTGDQLTEADRSYASDIKPSLERLTKIAGEPVPSGGTTTFKPNTGMNETQAANLIEGNTSNPSELEFFANPARFPEGSWGRAVGSWLASKIAKYSPQEHLRPEFLHKYLSGLGPEALDTLTRAAHQGFGGARQRFSDWLDSAANISTAPARHGLVSSILAAKTANAVAHGAGLAGAAAFGPFGYAAAPAAIYGISRAMESDTLKRAMAGQPFDTGAVARGFFESLPATNARNQQEAYDQDINNRYYGDGNVIDSQGIPSTAYARQQERLRHRQQQQQMQMP